MNRNTSACLLARALATGFALAILILSADAVVCVGLDGHFEVERTGAACCGTVARSAGPSALDAEIADSGECIGCADADLTGALASTTAPRPDVVSLPPALDAAPLLAPRATLAAASAALTPVYHRPASIEFARVISLRC